MSEQKPGDKAEKQLAKRVDIAKAFELRRKGLTYQQIGDLMGVSRQAVNQILARFEELIEHSASVPDDTGFADVMRGAAIIHVLDSVQPAKRAKMDGKAHAIAAACLIDKARLVAGQSTSNVSVLFQVAEAAEDLQRKPLVEPAVTPEVTLDADIDDDDKDNK